MSVEHARSGDVVELDPAGRARPAGPIALVRDDRLEVMRWVLPAGRSVPEHLAYGPATIQCVAGDTLVRLGAGERRLRPGSLVYLAAGERHTLEALADSILLVTMVLAAPTAGQGSDPPAPDGRPHGERTDRGRS